MKLRKGLTLVELVVVVAVAAILGVLMLGAFASKGSPGDGEKVGQIVKVARVGWLARTWEGELIRGGFQGASGVNGSAFDFTVQSDSLAHIVDSLMTLQAEVRIHYHTPAFYAPWHSESGHFLIAISPMKR